MISLHIFRIESISPLLMHNPASMGGAPAAGADAKVRKIPSPQEEAEKGAYRGDDGVLYSPGIAWKSSLLSGCVGKRIGKRAASVFVQAGVFEAEERFPLTIRKPAS